MSHLIYHFQFPDGEAVSVPVEPTGGEPAQQLPAWTRLEFHQCPNCPLSPQEMPHCPMAVSLVPLISAFGARNSFEDVTVRVESEERVVSKTTTTQRAVGSLMGVLSADSACPHVGFLKPMAHFHLPFSTEEETIYRVASMYLLAQYFAQQQGTEADWALDKLKAHYVALQTVNGAMAERLRASRTQDGALNALVLLDLLAKALPYSIDDTLDELRALFEKR